MWLAPSGGSSDTKKFQRKALCFCLLANVSLASSSTLFLLPLPWQLLLLPSFMGIRTRTVFLWLSNGIQNSGSLRNPPDLQCQTGTAKTPSLLYGKAPQCLPCLCKNIHCWTTQIISQSSRLITASDLFWCRTWLIEFGWHLSYMCSIAQTSPNIAHLLGLQVLSCGQGNATYEVIETALGLSLQSCNWQSLQEDLPVEKGRKLAFNIKVFGLNQTRQMDLLFMIRS